MTYLLSQMLLCLALAIVLGAALGWLARRARDTKRLDELRLALAQREQELVRAQSDVTMLTDDFDDLRQRSQRVIEGLQQDNRQVPVLAQNLEKSQLLVRQMIQRHDAEQRELGAAKLALEQRLATMQDRSDAYEKLRAELESERRRHAAMLAATQAATQAAALTATQDATLTAAVPSSPLPPAELPPSAELPPPDAPEETAPESIEPADMAPETIELDGVSPQIIESGEVPAAVAEPERVPSETIEPGGAPAESAAPAPSPGDDAALRRGWASLPLADSPDDADDDPLADEVVEIDADLSADLSAELSADLSADLSPDASTEPDGEPADGATPTHARDGASDRDRPMFRPVDRQDDLQQIFGITPLTERALNELGITSYSQLAELERHEIEKIADALQIGPERIESDDWAGNARRQLEEVLEQL